MTATLCIFLFTGVWYSPLLFGREGILGPTTETRGGKPRRMELIFGLTFLFQWTSASLLAAILGPNADPLFGLNVGLLVGLFFVAPAFGISYVFERRPLSHLFINAGWQVVCFGLMGVIIPWRS